MQGAAQDGDQATSDYPAFDYLSEGRLPKPQGDQVDFETFSKSNARQRRLSSSRSKTSTLLQDVVQETETVSEQVCSWFTQEAYAFWRDVASQLWLPLLGLITILMAFTVPMWLAIPKLLVGLPLVHVRAWQDWVQLSCRRCHASCLWTYAERLFAGVAVLLSILNLMYRVVSSGGGVFSLFDLLFTAFAVGGASSAWCRPTQARAARIREVPSTPVILLLLAIATLAPRPGLASLPYALLFLWLLLLHLWRSRLGPLRFSTRLCLLFLTSSHLLALLTLSFWGGGAPLAFVAIFGEVGRTLISDQEFPPLSGDAGFFWLGTHLASLLLLHFVLTNMPASRASDGPRTSFEQSSAVDGAKAWARFAMQWALFGNLVVVVLWFPSLMTLPLLLMAFTLTVENDGCWRCQYFNTLHPRSGRFRGLPRRDRLGSDVERNQVETLRGFVVCSWMACVFLLLYLFNIVQGEIPFQSELAVWLNQTFHLQEKVPVPSSRRSWLECIGLEYYDDGAAEAAGAFLPRAVLLVCVAVLEATLVDAAGPRHASLQNVGRILERAWGYASPMNTPEVGMVWALGCTLLVLYFEDGTASVLTVAYVANLVALMLLSRMRQKLWVLLKWIAKLGSTVLVLAYVVSVTPADAEEGGTLNLPDVLSKFITVRASGLPTIILPHLGIILCARSQIQSLTQEGPRPRISTGDSIMSIMDDAAMLHRTSSQNVRFSITKMLSRFLDRKKLRRLKLWAEEGIVLAVTILSLGTALLPPTDVHSLLLLAIVGPALLLYNLEDNRERLLIKALHVLQHFAAFFLLFRMAAASPLVPLPDDSGWRISLEEIGANRPATDAVKLFFLGMTTVLTGLAIKEATAVWKERQEMALEAAAQAMVDTSVASEHLQGIAPPVSLVRGPGASAFGSSHDSQAPPRPPPRSDRLCSDQSGSSTDADASTDAEAEPEPAKSAFFSFYSRTGSRGSRGLRQERSTSRGRSRRMARRRRGKPLWEEKLLSKWAPVWLPVQAHFYFSALLLIASFAVSITEVHLLNFLMISAVVSLCGWKELWVQAGNVFSVTTVGIMLLQYFGRFHYWDGDTKDTWMRVLGLEWSANQVTRHCCILALCFVQKQLWHRGRYSKTREPQCPPWLSRHADVLGLAALLVVAVARRHFWSPLLAAAALPWLVREEWEEVPKLSWSRRFFGPGQQRKRSWLRFFRLILLLTLLCQVAVRLVKELKWEDRLDVFLDPMCGTWEGSVHFMPGDQAAQSIRTQARHECIQAWHAYLKMAGSPNVQLLWEFLSLFFLGVLQQLFEESGAGTTQRRGKLQAMHWWPCLVYLLTFVLSLEGGTVLGLAHLFLLFGMTFTSQSNLAVRRRWAWRAQLCAWGFLFVGLIIQSPFVPCGRASCSRKVHQTFTSHHQCVFLQDLNVSEVETEAQTAKCDEEGALALGHDTLATLTMQAGGLRRIAGTSFSESAGVLLGSQLGFLLQLILAASVQVRIYNSATYKEQVELKFMFEPQALRVERARRYVHEFYCRCRLEEHAASERHRALRGKLKRTMKKIDEILCGRGVGNMMEEAMQSILIEELQLSHGVKKEVAREVTSLFLGNLASSKEYLDLLHLVTLGRLQPEGELLHVHYERLVLPFSKAAEPTRPAALPTTASGHEDSADSTDLDRPGSSGTIGNFQNRVLFATTGLQGLCQGILRSIQEWWDRIKQGRYFARCMYDYAFLGVDEDTFSLRSPFVVATEDLNEHRDSNGPLRLLWKVVLSNMASLAAVASVLAFIETRSVLDLLRTFIVFFGAVQRYPFPPHQFWTFLRAYSAALLVLRTFFDLPIFCAGPGVRTYVRGNSGNAWEPDNTFSWCPAVTEISFDITAGFAKRRGASALRPSSWFWAVWADHLCLWTVVLHQWMLMRSGLWDHVVYNAESGQVWLKVGHDVEAALLEMQQRSTRNVLEDIPLVMAHRPHRWGKANTSDLETLHKSLVQNCTKTRDRFIAEYYENLKREVTMQLRRARAEADRRSRQSLESAGVESGESQISTSVGMTSAWSRARFHMPDGLKHRLRRSLLWGAHSQVSSEVELYLFCLDGTEEAVQKKLAALVLIQTAVRTFLVKQRKRNRIRCLMGHPLQRESLLGQVPVGGRDKVFRDHDAMRDPQVCERCSKMIRSTVRFACRECCYYACNDCVQLLLETDQAMGKQGTLINRNSFRPGIALYWAKYLLGLVLLGYALAANQAIFKTEGQNIVDSVSSNNISVQTLILIMVHLTVLICDRIFHKWHYRNTTNKASLKLIDFLNVALLVTEFLTVHIHIIVLLRHSSNPREERLALHSDMALCVYYIGCMVYLGISLMQRKYGLPAVDHDTLRPTAAPDSQGIYVEKLQTFYWYFHYYLPFVDDLRVIIDWSVMPTSLDLWMHFKVEDAHSWLFRTRHTMFVRRQSFFAEPRDACEKVYSGWLLVLILVFLILMPIIVFSPITPFSNSVDIDAGTASLSLLVAAACVEDKPLDRVCRFERIVLYQAEASQILKYNRTRRLTYFEQHPEASTDIDIQEVQWHENSRVPLEVSPQTGQEVENILNTASDLGVPAIAMFEMSLKLSRHAGASQFQTNHAVSFCAPEGLCNSDSVVWPAAVRKDLPANASGFDLVRFWWQSLGRLGKVPSYRLEGLWTPLVHVGTETPTLKEEPLDMIFDATNCRSSCVDNWCDEAHCWGNLAIDGGSSHQLTITYELVRSVLLSSLSSSISTASSTYSVVGLYVAVVLVAGRYLRAAFQDSSKRAIYEEIPDVGVFLDLVTAIKLAREHRDLRTEFQLYYCLMKVLRSTNLLISNGGHEPVRYGAGRSDDPPPECVEPRQEQHVGRPRDFPRTPPVSPGSTLVSLSERIMI